MGGFTLIETLAAVGVFAMAISSAIIVLQSGLRNLDSARKSTVATQVSHAEMERLRLSDWTAICALPTSQNLDLSSGYMAGMVSGGNLTVTRRVADVAGRGSPSQMKEITLEANWVSIDGRPQNRIFVMRYARNGLFDYYYSNAQV